MSGPFIWTTSPVFMSGHSDPVTSILTDLVGSSLRTPQSSASPRLVIALTSVLGVSGGP
ncbi:MAG: hypothetical protein Kow0092_34680 [Deferrisomatales bacterium]